MSVVGSVSQLIAQAKDGDEFALAELHERYWPALVNIARGRLKGAPIRDRDAEDVAQTAFIALYQNLKANRLPDVGNRLQLLALLSHIVACRAINEIKRVMTQKQGGGQVVTGSPIDLLVRSDEHSPIQKAILNDCYHYYVNGLSNNLRPIAELHLAGFTNREIAQKLNCVERTVERKIALLRVRWQEMATHSIHTDVSNLLGQ